MFRYQKILLFLFISIGLSSASLASAAITYVGSASNPTPDSATATLLTTPVAVTPPTMQKGDLVVMIAQVRDTTTTMAISATGGQTWTSETQRNATAIRMRIFWCTFNGTWSANPSVAMGATNNTVVMHVSS
jgi:hypothetical protein